MIRTRAASLAIALCAAGGCSAAPDGCEDAVMPALQKVLEWPAEGWSFAIVEHRPSGRFIQYAYDDGLFIDIPADTLSEAERRAADALLGRASLAKGTNPAAGTITSTEVFQRNFGADGDARTAARFGCRVLHEVFALDGDAVLDVSFHGDPPPATGDGIEPPLDVTLNTLEDAARSGDAEAQYALATLLAERAADEATRAEADEWMRKAAAQGHPAANAALRDATSPARPAADPASGEQ